MGDILTPRNIACRSASATRTRKKNTSRGRARVDSALQLEDDRGQRRPGVPTKKITIEEAVTTDEFEHFDETFLPTVKPPISDQLTNRLHVKHVEQRLQDMDNEGVDIQVLSLTAPGVQSIADPDHAAKSAKETNDALAEMVSKAPTRFKALAALPWINPSAAVEELQRAVGELGAVGVMLNGHTAGAYMDDKAYWPVWEKAVELDVPVYLHPIQGQHWDTAPDTPSSSRRPGAGRSKRAPTSCAWSCPDCSMLTRVSPSFSATWVSSFRSTCGGSMTVTSG